VCSCAKRSGSACSVPVSAEWPIRDGIGGEDPVHAELGELVAGDRRAAAALALRIAERDGIGTLVEL
jgi:hypothetical protein